MRPYIHAVALTIFAASCQQSQSAGSPAGPQSLDAGADLVVLSLPAGCPPDAGNELGIGKPCTRTGSECASGMSCTCADFGITLPANMPCFCTNLKPGAACLASTNCGSNAICCAIQGLMTGCVPNACLTDSKCPVFQ